MQNVEINDLQEKVFRLEQQLSAKVDISPEQGTDCTQQEAIDLKSKLQSKVLLLILFFQFVYSGPLRSIPTDTIWHTLQHRIFMVWLLTYSPKFLLHPSCNSS